MAEEEHEGPASEAPEADGADEPDRWQRFGARLGNFLTAPILLVLAVGIVYAIVDAITADRPEPDDPAFLDTIIASDAVVAAIRIGVIAAAAFVVISVIALIGRRQWLSGFGPVRVSESVSELDQQNQQLQLLLYQAQQTIDGLEAELESTNSVLDAFLKEGDSINIPESESEGNK